MTIEEVVQMLDEGGIRSEAAFPAQRIARVTEPVAAVSLEEMDQENNTITVLVEILGPKEGGGHVCQSRALDACHILAAAGAVCRQGSCNFQNKSNLFRVQIRAVFSDKKQVAIQAGQWLLHYACGFSSQQEMAEEATSLQDMPWEITVEEFFPWGVQDTLEQEEPFTLKLSFEGKIERYDQCRWNRRERIAEKTGIRQIRYGTAVKRIITVE